MSLTSSFRPRGTPTPTSRAFTLVELLTVIAIIGILASIIIVTVSGVRKKAAATRCASNLRQIGVAIGLYANENRGRFPMGYRNTGNSYDNSWMPLISSYLGRQIPTNWPGYRELVTSGVYHCPLQVADPTANPVPSSYRMNWWLQKSIQDRPLLVTEVPTPSRTVLVTENPGHPVLNEVSQIKFSHEGKANILFVDGHVKSLSFQDAQTLGDPPFLRPTVP